MLRRSPPAPPRALCAWSLLVAGGLFAACSQKSGGDAAAGVGGGAQASPSPSPAGSQPGGTTPAAQAPSADTPTAGGAAAVCTTTGTIDVNVSVKTSQGALGAAAPVPISQGLYCQNLYDPDRSEYVAGAKGDFLSFLKGVSPGYLRWPTGYLSQKFQWSRDESAGDINDGGSYVITPKLLAAYVQLLRDVGAQAYLTVNIDADPASLADMVKFANIENKYGITWWEIGNEPDVNGYVDGKYTPQIYAAKAVKIAAAMRAADPSIKVAAGVVLSGENIRGVKPVDDNHAPISWARPIFDAFAGGGQMDGFAWHYYPMNASTNPGCTSLACYCYTGDNGCTSPGYLLQEHADDWPPAGLDYPKIINAPSTDGDSDNNAPFVGLRPMMNSYKPGMWMWISEFAEDPSSVAAGAGLSDKNIGMIWAADSLGRFADQGTEGICKFLYKTDSQSPQFKYTLVDENNAPRPSYYTYWLMAQHFGDQAVMASSDKAEQVAAHAAVRKQDGSLRLLLVNKNTAVQSVRVALADFKPVAAAQYQAVADSLYGTGVTLNGGKLTSANIAQGGQAIAGARAEACGDNIVKLPATSVTVLIYAK